VRLLKYNSRKRTSKKKIYSMKDKFKKIIHHHHHHIDRFQYYKIHHKFYIVVELRSNLKPLYYPNYLSLVNLNKLIFKTLNNQTRLKKSFVSSQKNIFCFSLLMKFYPRIVIFNYSKMSFSFKHCSH
jgi:hypothetical protein